MIEIKYEIFEDDISNFHEMDIQTFISEYNQLYGCFTLIINGIEYLPFPSPEMRLDTKRIYSELVLTHFDFLIEVYYELQKNNYVALKYIENSWTWLGFVRKDNELLVSQLNIEIPMNNPIQTNSEVLTNSNREEIVNEKVLWCDFETELYSKTKGLLQRITEINPHIVKAKCFDQISQFANKGLR
ncbi:hypothetical protein J2T17_007836 [Paenibacillus mucilaginosus]|uniref:hypothetical protein n=1 Tax=Paenibacillus mucilaginosus TaxID=61624 RepID=UPI003D1EA8B1